MSAISAQIKQGVEQQLIEKSTFTTWICSNIIEKGEPGAGIGGLPLTHIEERAGLKIGFIGIAERDWLVTFKNLDRDAEYLNYKRTCAKHAKELREAGCHLVIAITHMRLPHDMKLAEQVPGIDLVLAGHDHFYRIEAVESKFGDSKNEESKAQTNS